MLLPLQFFSNTPHFKKNLIFSKYPLLSSYTTLSSSSSSFPLHPLPFDNLYVICLIIIFIWVCLLLPLTRVDHSILINHTNQQPFLPLLSFFFNLHRFLFIFLYYLSKIIFKLKSQNQNQIQNLFLRVLQNLEQWTTWSPPHSLKPARTNRRCRRSTTTSSRWGPPASTILQQQHHHHSTFNSNPLVFYYLNRGRGRLGSS